MPPGLWEKYGEVRVTLKSGLIPFSGPLEDYVIPRPDDVIAAVKRVMME